MIFHFFFRQLGKIFVCLCFSFLFLFFVVVGFVVEMGTT